MAVFAPIKSICYILIATAVIVAGIHYAVNLSATPSTPEIPPTPPTPLTPPTPPTRNNITWYGFAKDLEDPIS
jgi:hypothetical protein